MGKDSRFDELFLFLEPSADPATDRVAVDNGAIRTLLAWVPDGPSAAKVAGELAVGGVRLIELYRGFDLTSAAQVIEASVARVPVGLASYGFGAAPPAGTTIRRSAVIYHNPGADPAVDRVVREHGDGSWTTVVASPEERMASVAVELVDAGAELVEICGGAALTTAERVLRALGGRVPVSHTSFPFESLDGVHAYKASFDAAAKVS